MDQTNSEECFMCGEPTEDECHECGAPVCDDCIDEHFEDEHY